MMHVHKKLGTGLAIVACLGMLSSSVMASHWEESTWPPCFRNISFSGNLGGAPLGIVLADLKYNTKTGHLHMKSERDRIQNLSCEEYSVHHIPGTEFCFPSSFGLDCHYRVSAHDCDADLDESAKLHGHN